MHATPPILAGKIGRYFQVWLKEYTHVVMGFCCCQIRCVKSIQQFLDHSPTQCIHTMGCIGKDHQQSIIRIRRSLLPQSSAFVVVSAEEQMELYCLRCHRCHYCCDYC